jgi:hypothetical protein
MDDAAALGTVLKISAAKLSARRHAERPSGREDGPDKMMTLDATGLRNGDDVILHVGLLVADLTFRM